MKQDHESVRTLAIQIGVRKAARQLGLKEDRVRQWSKREKWFAQPPAQGAVTTVTKPGDVLLSELAEHEGQTRLSLAKSLTRMAKDAEELPIRHVDKVHKAAQAMAIVHRQGEQGSQPHFTLNVLNMGALELQIGKSAEQAPGVSE